MQLGEKRRRRRHTPAFKATAVAACRKPGASVAAVALELQLNANMLRTWIKDCAAASAIPRAITGPDLPRTSAAFVPLKIETRTESASASAEHPIRVRIRTGRSRITIEWPVTAAGACSTWLRELLG